MPTVELSQGRIHYTEDGDGPAVVLLHGALVNHRHWRKVVPSLSGSCRVVVPDLPFGSHPEALRPDADLSARGLATLVAELLEALDLDDVTLVGNDTGGALAQLVAVDHPQRIGRLVLTSCDMFDNFPPKLFRPLIRGAQLPGVLTALGMVLQIKPLRHTPAAYGWLAKRRIPDDVLDSYLAPGRRADIQRDLKKVFAGVDPAETERAAAALRGSLLPTLLPWAADDKFFPVEHARRLASSMADARVEILPDSYTFTPEDQPELLAGHIAGFVRRESPAAAGR